MKRPRFVPDNYAMALFGMVLLASMLPAQGLFARVLETIYCMRHCLPVLSALGQGYRGKSHYGRNHALAPARADLPVHIRPVSAARCGIASPVAAASHTRLVPRRALPVRHARNRAVGHCLYSGGARKHCCRRSQRVDGVRLLGLLFALLVDWLVMPQTVNAATERLLRA